MQTVWSNRSKPRCDCSILFELLHLLCRYFLWSRIVSNGLGDIHCKIISTEKWMNDETYNPVIRWLNFHRDVKLYCIKREVGDISDCAPRESNFGKLCCVTRFPWIHTSFAQSIFLVQTMQKSITETLSTSQRHDCFRKFNIGTGCLL